MAIKVIAHAGIHPEAKIVGYLLFEGYLLALDLHSVPGLSDVPTLSIFDFNLPDVEVLYSREFHFMYKLFQLEKIIFEEFVLSPSQVFGKVVACSKRESTKYYFIEINFSLNEFRQQPIYCAIPSPSQGNHSILIIGGLIQGFQETQPSLQGSSLIDLKEIYE